MLCRLLGHRYWPLRNGVVLVKHCVRCGKVEVA